MIVYAQRKRTVNPAALESLANSSDAAQDALIEWGEVESAVADTLCPERDGLHPRTEAFRRMMTEAARLYWSGKGRLPQFDASDLPRTLEVSVPEGYAFYALHPRSYGEAALRFWEELRPRSVVVIGIRSIGTSLSAVACAAQSSSHFPVHPKIAYPGR